MGLPKKEQVMRGDLRDQEKEKMKKEKFRGENNVRYITYRRYVF